MKKFNGIGDSEISILKLLSVYLSNVFFTLCFIVAFSLFAFSFLTMECDVIGVSMQPTLNKYGANKCDVVYINNAEKDYRYGDIIVIDTDNEAIIKRIVGLPGDVLDIIRCEDGMFRLERNGEVVEEDYIKMYNTPDVETFYQNGMNNSASEFNLLRSKKPELFNLYGQLVVGEDSVFAMGDNRRDSQDSTHYGTFDYSQIRGVVTEIRYYGENELDFYLQFVGSGRFMDSLIGLIFN